MRPGIRIARSGPLGIFDADAKTNRTVYISVADGKGAPVTDLTAANFKVKEGAGAAPTIRASCLP